MVTVNMKSYLKEAIDVFQQSGENITRKATTPANKDLFEVRDEAEPLNDAKAESFHKIVAKLLYVTQRARVNLQTAIAFLCTRVAKPDTDDWCKLR